MSGSRWGPTPAGSSMRIVALTLYWLLHVSRWLWSHGMSSCTCQSRGAQCQLWKAGTVALLTMYPSICTGPDKDEGEMNEPLEAPRKESAPLFSLGQHNPSPPFPPREGRLRRRGLPPTVHSSPSWNSATGHGQALPGGRDTAGTLSPESHPTSHLPALFSIKASCGLSWEFSINLAHWTQQFASPT